jgi:thiol-disulfide isomerase/thioredoxin
MGLALLAARLGLAGVFFIAGVAKLVDRRGSRQALLDFGVPPRVTPALGMALPLAELAVAVALLPVVSAWLGAAGAFSLLLLFVFGIGANLAAGRTPDCHCFGQLHSAPAGWLTLVRNAVLAAIAGFVVLEGRDNPGMSIAGWYCDLTTAQRVGTFGGIVTLILLATEGMLLFQILRQQGRILLRIDSLQESLTSGVRLSTSNAPVASAGGLSIGTRAPGFGLGGLRGETITLAGLIAVGKPVLLLFTNPNCGPCQAIMPDIARWQRDHVSTLTIAVVTEGTAEENRAKFAVYGIDQVLLQQKREVAEMYQAWGTPAAALIRADGTIGSALAQGAASISRLVVLAAHQGASSAVLPPVGLGTGDGEIQTGAASMPPTPSARAGDLAPSLLFQSLDGKTVALSDFLGRAVLLLFWNPRCGFCQQLLSDLKKLEFERPSDAPTLVVISTGTVDENRAMNLRSLVVLDPGFMAGTAFGASGTPMGVLIDAMGRVASEVAAGAQGVLALVNASLRSIEQPALA